MSYIEKHREGARQGQLVEEVWNQLRTAEITESTKDVINKAIRFFGANVVRLPECNKAIFQLAEIFLKTSVEELIQWNFRDVNALLLLMVTMLLKRKDEATIRAAAIVVRKLIERLSEVELSRAAEIHQKPSQFVFHKMSKVATYYTQFKLLEVLHIFLRGKDKFIANVFKKEKLVVESGSFEDATHFFESLEPENFIMTARDFLDSYNQTMCNPSFIHSTHGFVAAVQEKTKAASSAVFFDFCLRNLSISFFVEAKALTGNQQLNEHYFVELEECDITVDTKRFVNPSHVQLIVKPLRYQILDRSDKNVENCQLTGVFRMIVSKDDEVILGEIVPLYQSKSPMLYENHTDMESLASFRTINTVIQESPQPIVLPSQVVNLNTSSDSVEQTPKKVFEKPKKLVEPKLVIEKIYERQTSEPKQSIEEIYKIQTSEHPKAVNLVKRQQKLTQVAKVEPRTSKQASDEIYDTVQDDSSRLPSFRQFMTQARERRQVGQSQEVVQNDPKPDEDEIIPISNQSRKKAPVKRLRAAAKKPAAKRAASKSKKKAEDSFEEVEDEVLSQFQDALHPSEPLAPVKVEPKHRAATLTCTEEVMNSSAEHREFVGTLPNARQRKKSYFTAKSKPAASTKARQTPAAKKAPKRKAANTQMPRPELNYSSDDFEVEKFEKEKENQQPPVKLIKTSHSKITGNVTMACKVKAELCANIVTKYSKGQQAAQKSAEVKKTAEVKNAAENPVELRKPAERKKPAEFKRPPKRFNSLRKQNNDLRPPRPESPVEQSFGSLRKQNNDLHPARPASPIATFEELPPEQTQSSNIRRPFEVIASPPKHRSKRSRPDGEENQPPVKADDNFDSLRNAEKQPRKKEALSELRSKKVSFHDNVTVISDESPSAKRMRLTEVPSDNPPIPLEVGNDSIQYNTSMLDDNELLHDFIHGSQRHSSNEEDNFDEIIMTTQTIQKKKSSPTIVRTVQYRQVNENVEQQPTTSRRITRATEIYLEKAREEGEKAMKELQELRAPIAKALKLTTKDAIKNAANELRSTHARMGTHIDEHLKLLKRVNISVRTMMQLAEESNDKIRAWRETAKQGMLEMHQLCNDRVDRIDVIKRNYKNKHPTLKKEAWGQYIGEITEQFNAVIERYRDF